MPYINQDTRNDLLLGYDYPRNPGALNYMITKLCVDYLDRRGLAYSTINDIVGALEGAKLEFYRRVAAPYENYKIAQNGDVYPDGQHAKA